MAKSLESCCNVPRAKCAKATVRAKAIFRDQEALIAATDRIKVLGKGRPYLNLGYTVEVQVISNPTP